ncbi:MAG TPA: 3-keto-5-aminohexanoate cleavage protein [Paracoccus sp. (in: a-proteobacteria)]|uniref:3-keto-5-aminohexanoate cleavage protein n=1 Tax=Paracoccus sp. TaxID=267 RepID=UPI002C200A35|nr:3-keto-5-aminohexanoate cleavage protein [Paracoccus sp. (in: a-proteobacteria)]HWL58625.1 3-keto-5-aminohexanoate cleavage protein [Paracoccus sp. (in: a-proteobacteria)]
MTLPFAIAVAPNGARRTKADHPRLPLTVAEMVREACAAQEAGAAMLHLHVRDATGRHVLDAGLYREALAALRRELGERMVMQVTTEAVGRYGPAEQIALVRALWPESVSLALRELFAEGEDEAAPAALIREMEERGTLWQLILYDAADLARMEVLQSRGLLPDGPLAVLPVLGRYSGTGADEAEFAAFLEAGIARHAFILCAFGPEEARFMGLSALRGGHARVGFENNLNLPNGGIAPNNAALVAACAEAAAASGRVLADAADLRRIWREPAPMPAEAGQ